VKIEKSVKKRRSTISDNTGCCIRKKNEIIEATPKDGHSATYTRNRS
jgi:hypothetical protein